MEPPPLAKRLGGTADSFRVYNGMLIEKNGAKKDFFQSGRRQVADAILPSRSTFL